MSNKKVYMKTLEYCDPATPIKPEHIKELEGALTRDPLAVALAAPQIGINVRMFATKRPRMPLVIAPEILSRSASTSTKLEGCRSLPGKKLVKVRRARIIKAQWSTITEFGDVIHTCLTLRGYDARVFQHEFDHLNGIMIRR